jgi:hypothetical protein
MTASMPECVDRTPIDLVLQMASQSVAFRVLLRFQGPSTLVPSQYVPDEVSVIQYSAQLVPRIPCKSHKFLEVPQIP